MSRSIRRVFGISVAISLMMIAVALHKWGATEVRTNAGEVLFLTTGGGAWLLLATWIFSLMGLSARDDVVERKNVAALIALCGAETAVAVIYAGGSLGEGPSYWNNVFSAALGTAGMLGLWILLEFGGKVSISIAEERDVASGLRLCGCLLATGLVLGRAVAGDWHSMEATIRDFIHDGWPAVVLCAIALAIERFARPGRLRPFPAWRGCGLFPALLYLALAIAWIWHLGAWEGMPE